MHRHISSCFNIDKLFITSVKDVCWLLIEENVSSSFFVDVYQLERSKIQFYFEEYIDIEKPEYQSSNHTLLIFVPISSRNLCNAETNIDWHIRYHQPSINSHINLNLPKPKLYIFCNSSKPDISDNYTESLCHINKNISSIAPCPVASSGLNNFLCNWLQLKNVQIQDVQFHWPVGNSNHQTLVVVFTLFIVSLGCFIVVVKSLRTNNQKTDHID